MFSFLKKIFGSAQSRLLTKYRSIVTVTNEWDEKFQPLSDEALRSKTLEFRERLSRGESLDDLLPEAYAVVKNVCRRLCGSEIHVSGYNQKWDMVPYDVQILGAISMHYGAIAEMQTGEGKTLTATMPLYLNALTGKPVHLVTVNDYLAERDCQWMGTIFRWLGLTVGALTGNVPVESRKEVYKCDIVYGTSSEFGFDYLRDNSMVTRKEDQVQRGYFYSIVDEIDSILIDEARTPLIISGPVPVSRQMYDALQGGVSALVKRQLHFCNRLATEARKTLDGLGLDEGRGEALKELDKEQTVQADAAYRKLWLVSKGTPRNKVLKRIQENPDMRSAIDEWDVYFHDKQNKEERAKVLADLFIIVDERASEYELTDKGIAEWGVCSGDTGSHEDFIMLDLGDEYLKIDADSSLSSEEKVSRKVTLREEDAKRKERAHNLRQLFRSHLLMEDDVDYIVQEGKVIIIDEHTGRPQPGRRFSDGLHQAIEAKEQVPIQKETQTYASITLQNYFRMYEKLSGMTGTAMTEAHEFKEIYKLEVLEIPTHVPCKREDHNDEIYMTEREKYTAILKEVGDIHKSGRPILIGTESVEVSEKLSRIFRQNKLNHKVLNAKHHSDEAEVIAQAGMRGAITISTNMAGRGTDIKLGEGVAELEGLYVLGTTRHQSRRIDRQLRGRCGRLGDPGKSKFYVSFEDSLMRLFASPNVTAMLKRFRPPEGEPISASILNRSIETAQKRIEQRNFMIRKHTLQYDDVMNMQRQEIYSFRNEILHTEIIFNLAEEVLQACCESASEEYLSGRDAEGTWDPEGFREWLEVHFPVSFEGKKFDDDYVTAEELESLAIEKLKEALKAKMDFERQKASSLPPELDQAHKNVLDRGVRGLMVRKVDQLWQEHLLEMDNLRTEVSMRTVGQKDPLLEFKQEAFELFHRLSQRLRSEIAYDLFKLEILLPDTGWLQNVVDKLELETQRSFVDDMDQPMEAEKAENQEEPRGQPVVVGPKVGRNDPCPCGSGKKFKKCCGVQEFAE